MLKLLRRQTELVVRRLRELRAEMDRFMMKFPGLRKRKPLSKEEWDNMKPLIERLWLAEKKSFKCIAQILEKEYDISPTKRQFDHIVNIWGLSKNIKKKDMESIVREGKMADVESGNGTILHNGRQVELSKIRRWQKRNEAFQIEDGQLQTDSNDPPESMEDASPYNFEAAEKKDFFNDFANVHITDSPKLSRFFEALRIECGGEIPPLSLKGPLITLEGIDSRNYLPKHDENERQYLETAVSVMSNTDSGKTQSHTNTQVATHSVATIWNPGIALHWLYEPSAFSSAPCIRANKGLVNLTAGGRYRENEELKLQQRLYQMEVNGTNLLQDPESLKTLGELGDIFIDQGRYMEAKSVLLRVAKASPYVFGPDSRNSILAYAKLASELSYEGKSTQALQILRYIDGIAHNLRLDDECKLEISATWAYTHFLMDQLDEAESLQREIVKLRLQSSGLENSSTLNAMAFLAQIMSLRGNTPEAELLLRTVIQVCQKLEYDTVTWFKYQARLAGNFSDQGRYDESINAGHYALQIVEEALGSSHPSTWGIKTTIAFALRNVGRLEESESMLRQNLMDRLRILGPLNRATINSQYELGRCLFRMGSYNDAAEHFEVAADGMEKILGETHELFLHCCYWLAECYEELKRYLEALSLYRRAMHGYLSRRFDAFELAQAIYRVEMILESEGRKSDTIADDIPWHDYMSLSSDDENPILEVRKIGNKA